MKNIFVLIVAIIMLVSISAIADNSPAGVWAMARGSSELDNVKFVELRSDGTGYVYLIVPANSWTAVNKIKWSLSGEKIRYSVVENDKGYSANLPVTFNDSTEYVFKNGILYASGMPMVKLEFAK